MFGMLGELICRAKKNVARKRPPTNVGVIGVHLVDEGVWRVTHCVRGAY